MTINNRFYVTLEYTYNDSKKAYYFCILDSKNNSLYVSDSNIAELLGISLAEYRSRLFFNFSNYISQRDRMTFLTIKGGNQEDKTLKRFEKAFKDNFIMMALS